MRSGASPAFERGYVDVLTRCGSMTSKPAKDMMVNTCGVLSLKLDDGLKSCLNVTDKLILLTDPGPAYGGVGTNCVKDSDTMGISIIIILCFSIAVQMAEGLHFGIVPYVSRPALGIVSGMVGAGGNLGSVIALNIFFTGSQRTDEGILWLGVTIMAITMLMFFVYFPDMGSMLTPAGGLGSYDPQLWKPPADYRGADSIDMSAFKASSTDKPKEANGHGNGAISVAVDSRA